MSKGLLTQLCALADGWNVSSALYWLPKDGELGLLVLAYEIAENGFPEGV